MTRVQYLYGETVDAKIWGSMLYKDVLELKAKLAFNNITKLYKIPIMERNSLHVNECYRAIRFNEKLLEEMK